MGTPFDFFSPKSWPADPSVSAEAQANRVLLAGAMRRRGFRPYDAGMVALHAAGTSRFRILISIFPSGEA